MLMTIFLVLFIILAAIEINKTNRRTLKPLKAKRVPINQIRNNRIALKAIMNGEYHG